MEYSHTAELVWSAYGLNWANVPDLDRALAAMAAVAAPAFEMRLSPELRERVMHSLDEMRAFASAIEEDFSVCTYSPRELMELDGDRVLIVGRIDAQGRLSTIPLNGTFAHLWEFENGKARRMLAYRTRDEALESAGVSG
ncbi:MAG: hypothetical protein QOG62_1676 [Thermoleophilaceae bacterium]|nr:hypothetical protein [Thermoleophilaceae bacterium]